MNALSILDIGRRINAASAEHDALDEAQGSNTNSRHYKASQKRLDALLDERIALWHLAISRTPTNLAEAAAQLGTLFQVISNLSNSDLGAELRVGNLYQDMESFAGAVAGLARVVSHAAGIDLAEFVETDLTRFMDRCYPPEPPALVSWASKMCRRPWPCDCREGVPELDERKAAGVVA